MKKMRKLLAVVLAITAMLAMSITSLAATSATVTVENVDSAAKVNYVQIITPDTSKANGWTFTTAGAAFYNSLKGTNNYSEQEVLDGLIRYADSSATTNTNTVTITAAQLETALNAVNYDSASTASGTETTRTFTASEAGVYAIKATTEDSTVVYSPMAAYVNYINYNTTTGVPAALQDQTVNAKKTELTIDKEASETDNVVSVGKTVTYTITGTIPYFAASETNVVYKVVDTISGATYVTDSTDTTKVPVTLTLGTSTSSTSGTIGTDGKLTIDLSTYAADRDNANKKFTITYQATVTETTVNNEAAVDDGTHSTTDIKDSDTLYTGTLTLTKTGESSAPLENAGFILYYTDSKSTKQYAKVTLANGVYTVTGWTTTEASADEMKTNKNGKIAVKGLDDSVTYSFKEVTAPSGYSINTTDVSASWDTTGDGAKAATRAGSATMTDTKLSSLPETGGIGTTIFTVVGIVVMVGAVALFFASKRKRA